MKRIFLLFLYFVSVLSAVSCIRELDDPAAGGKPVEVTFDISLGSDLTKADNTGLDNASGAFQLYVAVYNMADGTLMPASRIGGNYDPTATITGSGAQKISLTLSKGTSYKVIFFAQRTGAYDVSFADGGAASFSFKSELNANDGDLDAFYDAVDVSGTKTSYEVTLKRPFAQLNVLVKNEDVPSTQTAFESSMTVKAPTTFDLYAGAAAGNLTPISFAKKAIKETPFGQYATTHTWSGMNYVMVPADGHVEVTSFQESGMVSAIAPGKVPVKKNGRTNLVGDVYSVGYNATFTVQVNPGFGAPDQTEPIGGEETEITIADNNTYTPENPLVISATPGEPTPKSVTLLVAGLSLSAVADAAIGDSTIEANSSDETVATAAVDGDAVVITPRGDGEATITVTTPAFTKTDYRAATFTSPVKVEGMTPTGSDKIMTHEKFGCYLPDHERTYVSGVDQYVREYKGTPSTLDFVLLNAGENEQVIIRGYQDTMGAGDPVTVSVDGKQGKTRVLLQDYEMTVVKVENRKVWIADQEGNGFVIKK